MKRREFITLFGGAAVAWPLAARAQQTDRARYDALSWVGDKVMRRREFFPARRRGRSGNSCGQVVARQRVRLTSVQLTTVDLVLPPVCIAERECVVAVELSVPEAIGIIELGRLGITR